MMLDVFEYPTPISSEQLKIERLDTILKMIELEYSYGCIMFSSGGKVGCIPVKQLCHFVVCSNIIEFKTNRGELICKFDNFTISKNARTELAKYISELL